MCAGSVVFFGGGAVLRTLGKFVFRNHIGINRAEALAWYRWISRMREGRAVQRGQPADGFRVAAISPAIQMSRRTARFGLESSHTTLTHDGGTFLPDRSVAACARLQQSYMKTIIETATAEDSRLSQSATTCRVQRRLSCGYPSNGWFPVKQPSCGPFLPPRQYGCKRGCRCSCGSSVYCGCG